MFEPIAIVGQACTLPDALTPEALVTNVLAGRSSVAPAPAGKWRLPRASALASSATPEAHADRTWSDAGGYVRGFDEAFDPTGFALPADVIRGLDPVFRWVLHGARQAMAPVGGGSARAGLVLGNLSFPSSSLVRYTESVWLEQQGADLAALAARAGVTRPHAYDRFSSGLPAHLAARALGLSAGAFALDAACASSLYAIKLACDRLHDRTADVMIAGAVNAADDLFLHIGFCALSAMSKSGQSRPFHRDADGLVPAEGAGFVALMRLADAVSSGREILGVIRGVGLSNDGRGRGLLAPSDEGQERAMRLAYAAAELSPRDVTLLECHATGTVVGDGTEVKSTARVFAGCADVPIGSLKSNLGHLITAAGVAALVKVLGAMKAGTRPPTLHADAPIDALSGTPFRLLREAERWTGPRRAGISAFGFGGNNAHLIVEAWEGKPPASASAAVTASARARVAVVGLGARVGNGESAADFTRAVLEGERDAGPRKTVSVELSGLRFPPRDLGETLAQQLLLLEAAREATAGRALPRDRTGVLVGMGCDAEIARFGLRWRLPGWTEAWAREGAGDVDDAWLVAARDASRPVLTAAGVVGTMPNIPANRVNSQLDVAGPGFTVSAEEASGLVALELGARALAHGELDAVVVGAVELGHERVQQTALAALGVTRPAGDGAVALVLKRLDDARRDGDPVLAVLGDDEPVTLALGESPGAVDLAPRLGGAHAANGLIHLAAAVVAARHRARPGDGPATPWLDGGAALATTNVLEAAPRGARVTAGDVAGWLAEPAPRLHVFSGTDRAAALAALDARSTSDDGPARLVIVARGDAELAARAALARRWLEGGGPPPEGVAYRDRPVEGELAFVFTGAAAAYPGMGRDLALALPDAAKGVLARCSESAASTAWLYAGDGQPKHPLDQLWGTSFVCQLHAELTQRVLGLRPTAVIGYSSGESNSLFALGAWTDMDAMIRASRDGAIFTTELVGDFAAARRAWSRLGQAGTTWKSYSVAASPDEVRAALAGEPLAHLTIVNAPDDCVIGGEASACERVVAKLGASRALPLGYEMAAHCPEIEEIKDAWWTLHRRATRDVPGVRFYSGGTRGAYAPTPEACADAITGQALRTLDFPRMIEAAWADGVRVFVEHGPRGLCSGWIRRILGDRDHVAIPLDVAGRSGTSQAMNAVAWLVAAGVPVDARALEERLAAAAPTPKAQSNLLKLPAHPAEVRWPAWQPGAQPMPEAPWLPPILDASVAQRRAPAPTPAPPPQRLPSPSGRGAGGEGRAPLAPAPALALAPPLAPPLALAPSLALAPPLAPALAPPLAPASPMADVFARLAAHHAQLGAVHQDFLAQQADVHQRFLALRAATEASLLSAYAQATAGAQPVLPATPAYEPPPVFAPAPAQQLPEPAPAPLAAPVHVAPAAPTPTPTLPGPKYDRAALEVLASGKISSVFGPAFADQDGFARQVRMPEPPLLLADRVTGIDAVPGSMGTGTLWTETDVTHDGWYLDDTGRMPAGVMIEAGQADLLLISWLGVDRLNRGERVYRLLGCELTYHGGLPQPGDTLAYDIHVDGHAAQGDVRLFFFHYDCRVRGEPRLSVRHGQAGFFTDEELANSAGVLWDPATEPCKTDGPLDPPLVPTGPRSFDRDAVRAFAAGKPFACFGKGWEVTQAHVRSPKITGGRMLFLDSVTQFDPGGGPWGRGYLRAETPVSPDDWFFDGHFKNDPCMPGTLMFEGCLQAMAFYLAAMGFTIERDGFRFEPVPEEKYPMRCRGQVTPTSRHLTYEVFVSEVSAGPIPTVFADLLCTVDGRKAFHAKRVGLRLVPDFPLERWSTLGPAITQPTGAPVPLPALGGLVGYVEPKPVAVVDGFPFDYASLLACAWGPPSKAFGPFYSAFDGVRRVARLPSPPYHFMSRITRTDGPLGGMKTGTKVEVEYDLPIEQWYFAENGYPTMPFCVLMEAALQPCGWLASYVGSAKTTETDLLFRNLDGTGTLAVDILPGAGTFRTEVTLTSISNTAGMIIESFDVVCFIGDTRVFDMKTVFGFFPKEAFENQVGLPVSDEHRARIEAPSDYRVDLTERPLRYCGGELRLAGPMLLMLDRVTGYWPEGGKAGLGYLRAEKTVDPDEWFFKAHFFQDPVQPGSLGIEALCQLLQFYMLERDLGAGVPHPRFEPVMLGAPLTWKYRGQVVPKNRVITSEVEITEVGTDERGPYAKAEAWLWVDGKRVYHAKNLGMRIVPGAPHALPTRPEPRSTEETLDDGGLRPPSPPDPPGPRLAALRSASLDTAKDAWLGDHRPTWTLPAFPMMSMVDRLTAAAAEHAGKPVTRLSDVRVLRWLPVPDGAAVRLRAEIGDETADGLVVTLSAWRDAQDARLSRFEPVASAKAHFDHAPAPARLPALDAPAPAPDPYETARLFHGPAFQYLTSLAMGTGGSSATLTADRGSVPRGHVHQGLLDAATHGIPHDALSSWSREIPEDVVAYPYRIPDIRFFGELPDAGTVEVETRFAGFDGNPRFPAFDVQILSAGRVLAAFRLVEVLVPKGPIGAAPPLARRAFLRDARHVPGVSLSSFDGSATRLSDGTVRETDWLPGNVATIYGITPSRGSDLTAEIAVKDHVARTAFVHPRGIDVEPGLGGARARMRPLRRHAVTVTRDGNDVTVIDGAPPQQDLTHVRAYWRERLGIGEWPIEDLYFGLIERFVGDVVLSDPDAFAAVRGRGCLYLANHQVGIESLLFSVLAAALSGTPTVTLAKAEHRDSWLGRLIAHSFSYPGARDPGVIAFFQREDPASLMGILSELGAELRAGTKSMMVHVEGTRSLACRQPVTRMTSALLDMALASDAPIVPVRFVGGLPVSDAPERLDFPLGYGHQDIWLGRPILPEHLAALTYKDRRDVVLSALNGLGPALDTEVPAAPDPAFAAEVAAWRARTGAPEEGAVVMATLAGLRAPCPEVKALCEGARDGALRVAGDARGVWLAELVRGLGIGLTAAGR